VVGGTPASLASIPTPIRNLSPLPPPLLVMGGKRSPQTPLHGTVEGDGDTPSTPPTRRTWGGPPPQPPWCRITTR